MTGRELIIYILENGLENESVFENGKFVGFLTIDEAAEKLNVGSGTVVALYSMGVLSGVVIDSKLYIADGEKMRSEMNRK